MIQILPENAFVLYQIHILKCNTKCTFQMFLTVSKEHEYSNNLFAFLEIRIRKNTICKGKICTCKLNFSKKCKSTDVKIKKFVCLLIYSQCTKICKSTKLVFVKLQKSFAYKKAIKNYTKIMKSLLIFQVSIT